MPVIRTATNVYSIRVYHGATRGSPNTAAVNTASYQFQTQHSGAKGILLDRNSRSEPFTVPLDIPPAIDATVAADTVAVVASVPAPTVLVVSNIVVSVNAIAAVAAVPSPAVIAGGVAPESGWSETGEFYTVYASESGLYPAATDTLSETGQWVGSLAVAGGDATATPAAIAVTVSVPAPTVQAQGKPTPSVIAATVSVPAPTIRGTASTTPAAIAATVSVPTPTVIATSPDAKPTPATIAVTVAFPVPAIHAASKTLVYPLNLVATPISDTEIDLAWDAVIGAAKYDIERDGVVVVTGHIGITYPDTGLTADTEYRYRVGARP